MRADCKVSSRWSSSNRLPFAARIARSEKRKISSKNASSRSINRLGFRENRLSPNPVVALLHRSSRCHFNRAAKYSREFFLSTEILQSWRRTGCEGNQHVHITAVRIEIVAKD